MLQPKRRVAELLEQLNALRHNPQRDDMALARIEREARQLLSTDFGDARMVLGLVAGEKGDEALDQLAEVMRRYPNDPATARVIGHLSR